MTEIRSTAKPGAIPPLQTGGGIGINRADRRLFFRDVSGVVTSFNLGAAIGTTTQYGPMQLVAPDNAAALTATAGAGALSYATYGTASFMWNSGTRLFFGTSSAHDLVIATSNSSRINISAGGDVTFNTNTIFTQKVVAPSLATNTSSLGTDAGASTNHLRLQQTASNSLFLDIVNRRHTAGSDWSGTNTRVQRTVDTSAQGFIDFGVDSISASTGLGLGIGNTTLVRVEASGISVVAPLIVTGTVRPGSYTVATLPAGVVGAQAYVSNARKIGEAAGSGTGVPAYYSNGNWRRLSDDSPVAA